MQTTLCSSGAKPYTLQSFFLYLNNEKNNTPPPHHLHRPPPHLHPADARCLQHSVVAHHRQRLRLSPAVDAGRSRSTYSKRPTGTPRQLHRRHHAQSGHLRRCPPSPALSHAQPLLRPRQRRYSQVRLHRARSPRPNRRPQPVLLWSLLARLSGHLEAHAHHLHFAWTPHPQLHPDVSPLPGYLVAHLATHRQSRGTAVPPQPADILFPGGSFRAAVFHLFLSDVPGYAGSDALSASHRQ